MNFVDVKKEIESWDPELQDRLAASLSVIRLKRDPQHAAELAHRLDDRDSWLSLAELQEKLGAS